MLGGGMSGMRIPRRREDGAMEDLTLQQRAYALAWIAGLMAVLFAVWAVR